MVFFIVIISNLSTTHSTRSLQEWSDLQERVIDKELANQKEVSNSLTPLSLVILPDSYETQRCLDGSPFGYYIHRSKSNVNSKKWIIFLQGGGLCVEVIDCKIRQDSDQGSSLFWDDTRMPILDGLQDILSDNPEENPHFYDYNHVYLHYCSGDTWIGSRTSFVNGFWFSGHKNIEATIDHLNKTENFDTATHVLFTGSSAGGIGVFNNADYLRERWISKSTIFRAAPVSGFYFPGQVYLYPEYILNITVPFNNLVSTHVTSWFGSALDESCLDATPKFQHHKCWDVSYLYDFVDTRLFVIENRFDNNIIQDILLCPLEHLQNNNTDLFVEWFGNTMKTGLASTVQSARGGEKKDGLFSPSCLKHTHNFCIQGGPTVNGKKVDDMLSQWFLKDNPVAYEFQEVDLCNDIEDTRLPCNTYCQC